MEANILVISTADDYVGENVSHLLATLGKGLEVKLTTVQNLEKWLTAKWDYAIILNHCMNVSDAIFSGKVIRRVEMEFKNPQNDDECRETDAAIRKRILEFYINDIQGKEMMGADSCGAFCDL